MTGREETLRQQVAALQERNEALKELVAQLRRDIRKARSDNREHVDPLEHNTDASMDAFFEKIETAQPYIDFGAALRIVIDRHSIEIDGKHICDVGTGPALALKRLLKGSSPASVSGFDFSATALTHARQVMPEANFARHDIYQPLPAMYDVIFCTEVLEHLERPHLALAHIMNALTPDGIAVITVPDGRVDFSHYHINFWSPESWRVFIGENVGTTYTRFDRFRVTEKARYRNNVAIIRKG